MAPALFLFFAVALALRLEALRISARNEKRLRAKGAQESGARTSRLLALLHTAIYLGCLVEGGLRGAQIDTAAQVAGGVYLLAMLALGAVLWTLGRAWTVKILFLPDHPIDTGPLFRWLRHPNYILNLIPEVTALAVVFDAWITLALLVPAYLVTLAFRVVQEERALRAISGEGA